MAAKWPKIRSRRTTAVSPWMKVIAREVEFAPAAPPQVYHAVEQADYLSIVALTPAGRIPIVRQYRPAIEDFSWELPAGLLDDGEDPAQGCRRELYEETGFAARAVHPLGETSPCTGRLSNRIYSFFVETAARAKEFVGEDGITVKLVTPGELARMIREGQFVSQLHIGALLLAELNGFLSLPRGGRRPRPRNARVRPQRRRKERVRPRRRKATARSRRAAPPATRRRRAT
jgi:ADP-ribose pyrophosphatase